MNKKKLLALLMALVMTLTLVPVTAFADGTFWVVRYDSNGVLYATETDTQPSGDYYASEEDAIAAYQAEATATITYKGKTTYYVDPSPAFSHVNSYTESESVDDLVFKLYTDCNFEGYNVALNFSVPMTLDLNGHIVALGQYGKKSYTYQFQKDFILKDTSAGQTGVLYGINNIAAILVGTSSAGSTFTLESGTIKSETAIFDTYSNCTINVTGGHMVSYSKYGNGDSRGIVKKLSSGCALNISGGEFRSDQSAKSFDTMSFDPITYPGNGPSPTTPPINSNSTISVTGGTFSGQAIQKYVPGYTVDQQFTDANPTITVGDYTITRSSEISQCGAAPYNVNVYSVRARDYVAQVNDGQKYETLEAAITAASAGDTVNLLQDITLTAAVNITKNLTIDLGNHNITANDCRALHVQSGEVTINGTGTITSTKSEGSNFKSGSSVIRVGDSGSEKAKLTIGSGVIVNAPFTYGVTVFGTNTNGVELVVNGTVHSSGSEAAISGNGNTGNKGAVTINDSATVTADDAEAIYHPQGDSLTIDGGTITGKTGIYQKSGTLTVNGGTIIGNGDKVVYNPTGDDCNPTGDAIVIDNCDYPGDAPSANIKGATLTSTNGKQVGYYVYQDSQEGTVLADKAYTLSTNVPAKGWVANSGNNASTYPKAIGTPAAVAKVGDVEYGTLAAAIAAANATGNCTITLLSDYAMEANEPGYGYTTYYLGQGETTPRDNKLEISGNGVTFDLNGHTISDLFNNTFYVTGENVTIKKGTMVIGQVYYGYYDNKGPHYYDSPRYASYVLCTDGATSFVVDDLVTTGGINIAGGTTATINDLSFSGTCYYAICAQEQSTVTLAGGTYDKATNGAANYLFWIEGGSVMNITGGNYVKGNATFCKINDGDVAPIITGGTFDFDPTNYGVATGYKAVALTGENVGKWQVGKVEANASTEGDPSIDNEVTYTVGTVIKDGNEVIPNSSTIGQQVTIMGTTDDPNGSNRYDTITVDDPTSKTAVGAAELSSLNSEKVAEIVAAAVESAGTQAADVTAINVVLVSDKGSEVVNNTITYEVHPEAIVYKNEDAIGSYAIQNEELGDTTFTFKLNVSGLGAEQVTVVHRHNDISENMGTFEVDTEGNITLTVGSFSEFDISAATVDSTKAHFEFKGIGLRRRVLTSDHTTVVSNATDVRFGYELKGYVDSNTYYFQWKKEGGDWSSPIEITNFNAGHTEAALVVNKVPGVSFETKIYTRIFMVDSNGDTYVLDGTGMSVNDAITTIIDNPGTYGEKWVDYAAYLKGTRDTYTISNYID